MQHLKPSKIIEKPLTLDLASYISKATCKVTLTHLFLIHNAITYSVKGRLLEYDISEKTSQGFQVLDEASSLGPIKIKKHSHDNIFYNS